MVGILVIADLTRGTGRFNAMQGALATATGIGSSASLLMTGEIVSRFGFNSGFFALSAVAAAVLVFFGLAMPETRSLSKARQEAIEERGEPERSMVSH